MINEELLISEIKRLHPEKEILSYQDDFWTTVQIWGENYDLNIYDRMEYGSPTKKCLTIVAYPVIYNKEKDTYSTDTSQDLCSYEVEYPWSNGDNE